MKSTENNLKPKTSPERTVRWSSAGERSRSGSWPGLVCCRETRACPPGRRLSPACACAWGLPDVRRCLQMTGNRELMWEKPKGLLSPSVGMKRVLFLFRYSVIQLFATPPTAACQACLSFTISQSLLKLMSIESMMPSNHLILCCPLLLLPSIFPSISVFSNESALCIRWPKYWSFNFSISPSNEDSGLISFRDRRVGTPCCPKDSQVSSPTPQFKSISSSAVSLLYGEDNVYVLFSIFLFIY